MKLLTPLVFVVLFSLSLVQAYAQPGGPPCPKPPCPPPVPISGIEILIGGGILFGLKKLTSKKNAE